MTLGTKRNSLPCENKCQRGLLKKIKKRARRHTKFI